jgi:hypothetical protein
VFRTRVSFSVHVSLRTTRAALLSWSQAALAALPSMKKNARDMLQHGCTVFKNYKDIVKFFNDSKAHAGETDKLVEVRRASAARGRCSALSQPLARTQMVGEFLEKRQRKATGFLSIASSKKQIVKSLQTSILRQQAQVMLTLQIIITVQSVLFVVTCSGCRLNTRCGCDRYAVVSSRFRFSENDPSTSACQGDAAEGCDRHPGICRRRCTCCTDMPASL